MENKGEINKTEVDVDEKEQVSKRDKKPSRKKNIKEKALTAALVGGLLTGSAGCNVGQDNNQEKTEPIIPEPIEETLDIDREDMDSIDIPIPTPTQEVLSEEHDVFELPVKAEDSLHINLDSNIVEYIDNVYVAKGEVIKYPVFDTKEGQDHFENLSVFINSLFDEEIILNPNIRTWEIPDGTITYGKFNNFLWLDFEEPIDIPGVQINPESKESIQEGLKEITSRIVDGGFEHKIDKIVREGDYYKVHYRRLLNGIPFHTIDYQPYLYLSLDGKIKHAGILLREFEQIGEVSLLSGDEFNKNINAPDYPKTFLYVPASVGVKNLNCDYVVQHGAYGSTRFHTFDPMYRKGEDAGVADLTEIELVYYYRFLQGDDEKPPLPMFLLGGEGYLKRQLADGGNDKFDLLVKVLANAMSPDHIKGSPSK